MKPRFMEKRRQWKHQRGIATPSVKDDDRRARARRGYVPAMESLAVDALEPDLVLREPQIRGRLFGGPLRWGEHAEQEPVQRGHHACESQDE